LKLCADWLFFTFRDLIVTGVPLLSLPRYIWESDNKQCFYYFDDQQYDIQSFTSNATIVQMLTDNLKSHFVQCFPFIHFNSFQKQREAFNFPLNTKQ
jgi:hypothetical protein